VPFNKHFCRTYVLQDLFILHCDTTAREFPSSTWFLLRLRRAERGSPCMLHLFAPWLSVLCPAPGIILLRMRESVSPKFKFEKLPDVATYNADFLFDRFALEGCMVTLWCWRSQLHIETWTHNYTLIDRQHASAYTYNVMNIMEKTRGITILYP
jgi:hypothetical protein